jgi:hypothetical protein
VDGKRATAAGESHNILLFDNMDEAAKKYDEILRQNPNDDKPEFNFMDDGSRVVYDDITPASTTGLGGSAANVVPALSVINIKDLPPDVKPLLRDPRQTSRTGGKSKRHVYAYRGVCRQARKGHDRWQSQISFMGKFRYSVGVVVATWNRNADQPLSYSHLTGVNHYLGTFDSEWDAAAIYAWAHLILYGEEATRQAQKEGEEAAAAYEQEMKDMAEENVGEGLDDKDKRSVTDSITSAEARQSSASKSSPVKTAGNAPGTKKRNVASRSPLAAKGSQVRNVRRRSPITGKMVTQVRQWSNKTW